VANLRQLHYFVTIAQEGQITRAARKLHLAQPALSQAIAQLESQLGVQLFVRHARGVSLTPAGDAFFGKAQAAVAAAAEAEQAVQSLVRATMSVMELGFLGSPPMVDAPELFAAFNAAHPDVQILFHELPFPGGSTASWIEEVDVALCFSPTPHPDVQIQPVRAEPRVVVLARSHPLAKRTELTVDQVLDETFPGAHPSVEPVWAGFWRLDDHRGGPARRLTADRPINPQEMAAVIAAGHALTTTPASNAKNILRALTSVVAIPLRDADPAMLSLVWHKDNHNPLIEAMVATAKALGGDAGERPQDS
jgi:DNA-binding transcriptional LysR family regulator